MSVMIQNIPDQKTNIDRITAVSRISKIRWKYSHKDPFDEGVRAGLCLAVNKIQTQEPAVRELAGAWLTEDGEIFDCSECGYSFMGSEIRSDFRFCPWCGSWKGEK